MFVEDVVNDTNQVYHLIWISFLFSSIVDIQAYAYICAEQI